MTIALLVGACVLIAATIVGFAIAMRDKPAAWPDDLASRATVPPANVVGPVEAKKSGVIETKWSPIAVGPPVSGGKSLVAGIDVAPPSTKIIRSFAHPGAAALALDARGRPACYIGWPDRIRRARFAFRGASAHRVNEGRLSVRGG